jgi:hypothetical protein
MKPRQPERGAPEVLRLEAGAARFVYRQPPGPRAPVGFSVSTKSAMVTSHNGQFRVDVRKDTTDVEVYGPTPHPARDDRTTKVGDTVVITWTPEFVIMTTTDGAPALMPLLPGEAGRMRWGEKPVKLRAVRAAIMGQSPLTDALMKHLGTPR